MKVAILGAGISGLSLAYYLQKLGVRYDLFEASADVGGMVKSYRQTNYRLELGPHALTLNDEVESLLQELKLDDQKVMAASVSQNRYIRKNGKYFCLPQSPLRIMLGSFFSWRAKLLIAQETKKPLQEVQEETVSQFFARRFGQEVVDYLVQPVVSGIYAGNPDHLLLEKTFPFFKTMERKHGSILKALLEQNEISRKPIFTLAQGLQSLPEAIASKLVSLHVNHQVEMVHKVRGKYFLSIKNDEEGLSEEEYDAVVLALPAPAAADLLQHTAPGFSAALQNVNYTPLAVVHTTYHKQMVGFPLNGFGALHPEKEKQFSAGSIWTSSIFPDTCPDNEAMFSTYIGGSLHPKNTQYPGSEIKRRVHSELKTNYSISATSPLFQHCQIWDQALPQPDIFILDVHQMAQKLEEDRIYACTNWMAGPSVPDCIRYAKEVAQKIYSQRLSFP